jgi:glycosyltransferase involved in cell wall biosynthesis
MGVDIVNLPFNLGYGSALQTGYKYAVLKNYDYLITYDADYQHRAEDLNTVYDMLIEDSMI